ncbi:hypothetical protein [Paenibacillus cymbidii]|uniref:hypothetical protein n=1 Tax=Paenibacillus cymbidii TaxID=1639034 RepID=UPI001080DFF9|nr:hypothetical protein [Paenibacillus cymbidii]
MKPPVSIGTRVEPFVDDWLIDEMAALRLKLHPPERKEVVFVPDRPWEGPTSGYFSVIQDEDRIRLYYRGYCPGEDSHAEQTTCYAESADGIHFVRPELGLHPFGGSNRNNIILRGVAAHNFAPFLDRSQAAGSDARYKAVGGVGTGPARLNVGELFALASADGVHWRYMQEGPVMTDGGFDSHNVAFWDDTNKRYRCYNRYFHDGRLRAIQSAESVDFLAWGPQRRNEYAADAPEEHFYTNSTIPCPGAEQLYVSFPMRFVPERQLIAEHAHPGVSDTLFMTSRDGVRWDRSFREAWLRPGPDRRNWTDRSGMAAFGAAELAAEPGRLSFYVTEHYRWDDMRLRRVSVRKHGFASVHADYDGGTFVTRPLTFAGSRLLLNFATSAAGSIRAELLDASGQPVDGYRLSDMEPLYGDTADGLVEWRNGADLTPWIGRTVRFRFELKDADLFALRTAPADA